MIRSVCGVGACWYAAERYFGGLWLRRRRDRRENRRRFFGTKIILYLAALSGRDPFDAALRPGLSPGIGCGKRRFGEMSEWFKERAWKVRIPQKGIVGSNPAFSAKFFFLSMPFPARKCGDFLFVDGIISVLIPVSIQALVPILMPVLMLTSRPRKFWQLSFSVRSQVRIMPAWYAFFRQMILAGRRSSDKVPSLLAHSAGTRKQKRPFLCRTAAFLWGKNVRF